MAVGKIFEQYSVICVFGSVVGCVVVPLIAQSIESLIFSAIVVTLTAKTFHQRILAATSDTPLPKDDHRKSREKDRDREKEEKRTKRKKPPSPPLHTQPTVVTEHQRKQREKDIQRQEAFREAEKERRMEERRERKARKREERIKRKEDEKTEKEREDQLRRERHEVRVIKKQQEKATKQLQQQLYTNYTMPDLSQLDTSHVRPLRRERKHSSSSTSSSSTHSVRSHHARHPLWPPSDLDSPIPSPLSHTPSPSQTRAWQTPSQNPLYCQPPDIDGPLQRVQHHTDITNNPSLQQQLGVGVDPSIIAALPQYQYPSPVWLSNNPPGMFWNGEVVHPELVKSHSLHVLNQRGAWVPATDPSGIMQHMAATAQVQAHEGHSPFFGSLAHGYYSLFNGQSPFDSALLSSNANTDATSVATANESSTTAVGTGAETKQEFDEWPIL